MTLGSAVAGGTEWSKVPLYILAQMVGAAIGAVLAWALYYAQFAANAERDKAQPTLGIFSTGPEIRKPAANLVTEIIATIGLVLPLLFFGLNPGIGIGQVPGGQVGVYGSGINVLLVALLVVGIGLSLGGPTGYAINPARDLGPRLVHALLPIPNKGGSDWSYAWIPVVGPLIGAVLSGLVVPRGVLTPSRGVSARAARCPSPAPGPAAPTHQDFRRRDGMTERTARPRSM